MKKISFYDLEIDKLISQSESSQVYRLQDGSVLKIFSELNKLYNSIVGINLEEKIISAEKIENVPEIIIPSAGVYSGSSFIGYTNEYVQGINYGQWDDELTLKQRTDLGMYAKMHSNLEDIVRRANGKKIIMPDLLTCDNIIITNNGKLKIIDYDGLQIGKFRSVSMSTSLGNQGQYEIPKYKQDKLFTHNLDKKSLILLYFLQAFNINLENIGRIDPKTGKPITLDDIFELICLDDDDVKQKVWKCYQKDCPNEFLGDDVFKIAEKYDMVVYPILYNNQQQFIKRLYRKK